MEKTIIASPKIMTDRQVENLLNRIRDAARRHQPEIPRDIAQWILGISNLGSIMFYDFLEMAKEMMEPIIHYVEVDRSLSHDQQLGVPHPRISGSVQEDIFAAMPTGSDKKTRLIYFKPSPDVYNKKRKLSPEVLETEYEKRGLVPDPDAQMVDNLNDRAFIGSHPNACQWKDKDGKYCFLLFYSFTGGGDGYQREIWVARKSPDQYFYNWDEKYWFAGVEKNGI
jgi:hypothetical protein